MHSALFIAEVLFLIFRDPILASYYHPSLKNMEPEYLRRHPLLSLALSCKTFCNVALCVLWEHIDGIDQLLRTMSDNIIELKPWASSDSVQSIKCDITFKRQPIEQDWEPFDRYGALVVRFNDRSQFTWDDLHPISSNVLDALKARYDLKGAPLLPNLQFLDCQNRQFRYAHTLLGPRLHSLCISGMPMYEEFAQDAWNLLELARPNPPPQLKSLQVGYIGNNPEVQLLVSEFLINVQRNGEGLHSLNLHAFQHGISLDALSFVLTGERLRDVQVSVKQFDLDQVLPLDTSGIRKDLHTVDIRTTVGVTSNSLKGGSLFREFLRRLNAPNLVSFMFWGAPDYVSVQDVRALFAFLQMNSSAKANVKRTISVPCISTESLEDMAVHPGHHICTFANSFYLACRPISSTDPTPRFVHLQDLTLNVLADLSDSNIDSLSSSLPQLTNFDVAAHRAGRTGRSRTTLIGIWLLAKNCKSLKLVSIWFNAVLDWEQFAAITQTNLPDITRKQGRASALRDASNRNLTTILIGDSNIGDPRLVIEFFRVVCPHLNDISWILENEDGWQAWGPIRALFEPSDSTEQSLLYDSLSDQ